MAPDGRPLPLNMAEIEFSALARQCLNRRIGNLEELSRQVGLWVSERNQQAVKPGRRSGALEFYGSDGRSQDETLV